MKNMLQYLLLVIFIFGLSASGADNTLNGQNTDKLPPYRVGKWLPSDQQRMNAWVAAQLSDETASSKPLKPVVQKFKDAIENDSELFMLFHEMFSQLPDTPKFKLNPVGEPQITNYHQFLQILNNVLEQAPEFDSTPFVGFPIARNINWPMGTPAGRSAFLNKKVNKHIRKILNQWAVFLSSPESRYVLNDNPKTGWFGQDAMKAMPTFVEDFSCDPEQPYYGFTSWDDFFTRKLRPGSRPVASPDDDSIIANSCESAPYKLATNVKQNDQFWIKSEPYSLYHMLDGDPLTVLFEGGATVYQAFLSALSYHRWHSPVSGRIVKTRLIPGSYYSESPTIGYDPVANNESQAFISHVATRALAFIEADNPDIGLMAVLYIGMEEVSSNEFTVYEGQHVNKGDELGMFHFGGSTHCLIFRPETKLEFDLRGQTPSVDSKNIPVRSKIATVINK